MIPLKGQVHGEVSNLEQRVSDLESMQGFLQVPVTPTEGQTITCPDTNKSMVINMTPAGDINELLLVLPPDPTSLDGQRVFIRSSEQIAQITVTGATTVDNPIVMMNPGDCVVFLRCNTQTWSRVS